MREQVLNAVCWVPSSAIRAGVSQHSALSTQHPSLFEVH